ncbi:DUF1552 domain-containing protein [Sorangium sp. So ce1128]
MPRSRSARRSRCFSNFPVFKSKAHAGTGPGLAALPCRSAAPRPASFNPTFAGLRRDLAAAAAQAQSRKRLFVGGKFLTGRNGFARATSRGFIQALGFQAWRRPLETAELDRLMAVATEASTELGSADEGARWATVALFTSPNFLYRAELGAPIAGGSLRFTGYDYVTWFFGNGTLPGRWKPTRTGSGAAWDLSPQLQPLAALRSHLTVISGLENKSVIPGVEHPSGSAGATTGAPISGNAVRAASIDQVVADAISAGAAYRSIEVGVTPATPNGPQARERPKEPRSCSRCPPRTSTIGTSRRI